MTLQQDAYPVQLNIDYPEEPLNRLSSFFRLLFLIPIGIVLAAVNSAGLLLAPPLLLILFRQKYPRWWFDWNLELMRFTNRVTAYAFLLRDEYPSTDEEQSVHLNIAYPDVPNQLNRWLPLVKFWLLAIPHYIVLAILGMIVVVVWIIAWFAILFTGRYPRDLFNFIVGVMRWSVRVQAYAVTMTTDKYPPFRLGE